jgi:putative ABC transport system ATP-binding protein
VIIEARELKLIYDRDKDMMTVAVDNADFTLHENEMAGVMGPSGSGKSSLLYLLSGLKTPTSGSVFYDGENSRLFSESQMNRLRRERFGFIFQRHFLISHLTVLENILLPLPQVNEQAQEDALNLLDALQMRKYQGKKPAELSVGERQKVAVLRALIHKPQVLFADEPTASLDIDTSMAVMELMKARMQDKGIVVVTHDYKILKNADRIVHMRDGRLV